MKIAEQSLQLLRDSQATNEENSYMSAYANLLVEISKMKDELINNAGKLSGENYEKKESRINDLEQSTILFSQCYFTMLHYKQEMVTWKHKALEKELEFVNFVTQGLEKESHEQDRR